MTNEANYLLNGSLYRDYSPSLEPMLNDVDALIAATKPRGTDSPTCKTKALGTNTPTCKTKGTNTPTCKAKGTNTPTCKTKGTNLLGCPAKGTDQKGCRTKKGADFADRPFLDGFAPQVPGWQSPPVF